MPMCPQSIFLEFGIHDTQELSSNLKIWKTFLLFQSASAEANTLSLRKKDVFVSFADILSNFHIETFYTLRGM